MNRNKIRRNFISRKKKLLKRLAKAVKPGGSTPTLTASNIHYEVAERTAAIPYGGIGLIHRAANTLGLAKMS